MGILRDRSGRPVRDRKGNPVRTKSTSRSSENEHANEFANLGGGSSGNTNSPGHPSNQNYGGGSSSGSKSGRPSSKKNGGGGSSTKSPGHPSNQRYRRSKPDRHAPTQSRPIAGNDFAFVDTETAPPPTEIIPVDYVSDADFERDVLRHGLKKPLIQKTIPVEDWSTPASSATPSADSVPVEDWSTQHIDLSRYGGDLGYGSETEAYDAYQNMSDAERGIFNSYENPSTSDRIGKGIIRGLIPGVGLVSKYMWDRQDSLKDKIDYSKRTAATVARNKERRESGALDHISPPLPPIPTAPKTSYSSTDEYRKLFENYKF